MNQLTYSTIASSSWLRVRQTRSRISSVRAAAGISLTVEAGELVALYGPSGSGKTTLLLLAAGILRPDSGQVRFDGRNVAAMGEREAAAYRLRDVGIVFQSFHLIPGASALDNATVKLLGRGSARREARRRAQPWLDRVGIGSKGARHPAKLSAGERQRVAVARALASEPRLLLADEPTGNLDSENGRTVLSLLSEICHSQGSPSCSQRTTRLRSTSPTVPYNCATESSPTTSRQSRRHRSSSPRRRREAQRRHPLLLVAAADTAAAGAARCRRDRHRCRAAYVLLLARYRATPASWSATPTAIHQGSDAC